MLSGLCFSELGGLIPASGGEYAFLNAASRSLGKYTDVVPFLHAWGYTFVVGPASNAVQGLTMASYALGILFPSCDPPSLLRTIVAFVCIALMTAMNSTSVKTSARIQDVLGFLKLAFLISIVGTGAVFTFRGTGLLGTSLFTSSGSGPPNFAAAFYSATYTISGWQYICCIGEEVSNPGRNIPRAVITGVVIVTTLYILVNLSYIVVLGEATAASSAAIGVSFASASWGSSVAWLVPTLVFVCVFGSTLGSALCVCRVTLSAARQGHLPSMFSLITINSSVPLVSVQVRGLLALAYASISEVGSLIDACEFVQSLATLFTISSLFLLRYRMKNTPRPYRVPTAIAVLALFAYLFAVIIPFTQPIRYLQYVVIAGILFMGVLYYVSFVVFRCQVPGAKAMHVITQKVSQSVYCINELDLILKEKL